MRWLNLYLRSRQVPAALAAAVAATAVLWLAGAASVEHARPTFAVLAIGFAVAVFGAGLGGTDADLDRTAAIRWPPRRFAHVVGVAVVVAGAVAVTGLAPAEVVLRDAIGVTGLLALGAAVLGKQLSWCLPVAWAGGGSVIPALPDPPVMVVLTWPTQPPGSVLAFVVAVVLGVGGLLSYVAFGSRR